MLQLTQMAKAAAGYYPLGRNGLWHGGVHFDNGTAGTLDQSAVHCLADDEVVAYRIDEHSPTTNYFVNKLCVPMPFSRNFVLVRHRLEAPKIEGSTDAPPSLIFYSLYMHLQDWAIYRDDASIPRPGFWPEAEIRRIKAAGVAGERGHRVYGHPRAGEALGLLPAGTEVTVSGEGEYRKLKNTNGPDILKNADGSLRGYVAFEHLVPIAGDEYRVSVRFTLNIRAEPSAYGEILMCLTNGTEVAVSGEGKFRKLERVNQYVDYDSLEEAREPIADRIVVPDKPVAIKAGDLIGHIGEYQDQGAEHPEKKLHLEVFSDDPVDLFIKASRAWAQRLPDTGKTWLKLAKGAAVVAHQAHFSTTRPPTLNAANTPSDADLLVPKSLIDGPSAENKIVIAATAERAACNWYRLDGLLHDENCVPLDGWVREEVGVTPWISPWSWDGYDVIYNYDPPRQTLASFLRAMGRFTEEQLERHGNLADLSDQGVMRKRLYDIIDRDRDGKMTAEELQAAISLPALAQSLSQLIIRYESEWRHTPRKWDALDEVLGHSGSTPLLNWVAEKERIREISWWNEVEERIGLPVDGKVYHFHPIGLLGNLCVVQQLANDLTVRRGQITFDAEGNDIPNSPFYSRRLHWPGGASGVTLGRGYDIRHRTQSAVRQDLIAAGVDIVSAENFSRGAGLFGDAARDFVSRNRDTYGTISLRAQRILFEDVVYPRYERAARQQYNSSVTSDEPTWEQLDGRVRDIAVDLTYQQGSVWNRQAPYIRGNDKEALAMYIQDTPELVQYEKGRNRVRYLLESD